MNDAMQGETSWTMPCWTAEELPEPGEATIRNVSLSAP